MPLSSHLKVFALLVLSIGLSPSVAASEIQWLSYPGRLEVTRTTVLLAQGYPRRALQLAAQVDSSELKAAERLILAHNRCLALHWLGQARQARTSCEQVRQADEMFNINWQRGAWRLLERDCDDHRAASTLSAVLDANLSRVQGLMRFSASVAVADRPIYTGSGREK